MTYGQPSGRRQSAAELMEKSVAGAKPIPFDLPTTTRSPKPAGKPRRDMPPTYEEAMASTPGASLAGTVPYYVSDSIPVGTNVYELTLKFISFVTIANEASLQSFINAQFPDKQAPLRAFINAIRNGDREYLRINYQNCTRTVVESLCYQPREEIEDDKNLRRKKAIAAIRNGVLETNPNRGRSNSSIANEFMIRLKSYKRELAFKKRFGIFPVEYWDYEDRCDRFVNAAIRLKTIQNRFARDFEAYKIAKVLVEQTLARINSINADDTISYDLKRKRIRDELKNFAREANRREIGLLLQYCEDFPVSEEYRRFGSNGITFGQIKLFVERAPDFFQRQAEALYHRANELDTGRAELQLDMNSLRYRRERLGQSRETLAREIQSIPHKPRYTHTHVADSHEARLTAGRIMKTFGPAESGRGANQ